MSAFSPHFKESQPAIAEILKAFGFDAKKTRSFELRIAVDDAVTVRAQRFAEIEGVEQLVTVLKRFKVVPLEDPE